VGDPEAERDQLGLLVGGEQPRGQPAQVERLPEAVPGPGEVVPDRRRPQPGVDAAEQHPHARAEHVGHEPALGALPLGEGGPGQNCGCLEQTDRIVNDPQGGELAACEVDVDVLLNDALPGSLGTG
jgi:hypothetical protein